MSKSRRIGILTSGGDCSGLNAVIRAVVHCASGKGWEVFGIRQATLGLMARPPQVSKLEIDQVDPLLTSGGTMLGTTNKGDPFAFPMPDGSFCDRSSEIIAGYHQLDLDALIGIGGDGSLAILRRLAQQGAINLVGIPKTIDNDIGITEHAIGFDTAVNIATEALDRLHFTAASHSRVMILEVMGRDAGHIALAAGIAGGADVILIPEILYSMDDICYHIKHRQEEGKNYCLIIVSEAVRTQDGEILTLTNRLGQSRYGGIGEYLADQISDRIGAETRVTVLGHIQRGGIASPLDRLVASAFGVAAVNLIEAAKYDYMVAWQNRQVITVPIEEAIAQYKAVNPEDALVKTARGLGIYLGE
ncbi:ATP-dependent 6-phosphofructokinase (plasmid) [Anabaena sp. FACHB-709]|uniref:ATP-dependent 6-phosphofructokinase 1 n=4 Tax=Nostocaceae TaxID=1162 RepID=PFKA1_NOSS1|nr:MULTISPECIES: ATP-dependent 6-phosphofructokinase [Nostocaceae]Q8YKG3.1 RecName: Full=ATP-dependent 6-phosphofructokinase 1; Short=ATP-PFK 1; Short=Phosphofructokinase 1; AltName: Full=Phosphohexokinase 1 [Nostoc sp. PCC 7120 = FACHB-418]BAY72855.1 6-phosphofructokinase [Trichormus variabilis NIES-23]MBD2175152.1 ATP-dependent 6-phosphofructokinase [Anabaena cylindrica FACHB-318]MBD2255045.1 ATP-dependent 6-phosphofructokinase [Nostoc parmelioides FACHB-3921]MBD2267045.1 ATP-dependent 6-pho